MLAEPTNSSKIAYCASEPHSGCEEVGLVAHNHLVHFVNIVSAGNGEVGIIARSQWSAGLLVGCLLMETICPYSATTANTCDPIFAMMGTGCLLQMEKSLLELRKSERKCVAGNLPLACGQSLRPVVKVKMKVSSAISIPLMLRKRLNFQRR